VALWIGDNPSLKSEGAPPFCPGQIRKADRPAIGNLQLRADSCEQFGLIAFKKKKKPPRETPRRQKRKLGKLLSSSQQNHLLGRPLSLGLDAVEVDT